MIVSLNTIGALVMLLTLRIRRSQTSRLLRMQQKIYQKKKKKHSSSILGGRKVLINALQNQLSGHGRDSVTLGLILVRAKQLVFGTD